MNFGNGFGKFLDDRDHAILPHAYLMSISELRNNANQINRLIELKFIYQTDAKYHRTGTRPVLSLFQIHHTDSVYYRVFKLSKRHRYGRRKACTIMIDSVYRS